MYTHSGQRPPATPQEFYLSTLAPLLSRCINAVCRQTDPNLENRQRIYQLASRYECSWQDLTTDRSRTRIDPATNIEITIYRIHAPAVLTFGAGLRDELLGKQWYTRPEVLADPGRGSPYVLGTFAGPGYALHLNSVQNDSAFEARSGMNEFARAGFRTSVSTPHGHSLRITQNDPHTWLSTSNPPHHVEWSAVHEWSEWGKNGVEHGRIELDLVLELRAPTFPVPTLPSNPTISSRHPLQPQFDILAHLLTLGVKQICSMMEPKEKDRTVFPYPYESYECKWEDLYLLQGTEGYGSEFPHYPVTTWKVQAPAVRAFGAGFTNGSQWYLRSRSAASNGLSPYTICQLPAPGYALRLDSLSYEARPRTLSGLTDFYTGGCRTVVKFGIHTLFLTQRNGGKWLQDQPLPPTQVEYEAKHQWRDEHDSLHTLDLEIVFKLPSHPPRAQFQFVAASRTQTHRIHPPPHYEGYFDPTHHQH